MNQELEKKTPAKESSTEIVPQGEFNIQALIGQAIEKNVSADVMERMLTVAKEMRAIWAKSQFDNSMADFQSECPVIAKSREGGKTKSGYVAYYYAPLDVIVEQVKGLLAKHGFSYSTQTITNDRTVKVTCIAKHRDGYSESSDMEVPISAGTNVMSASQVVAAAITYAKRYAFLNVFGILTGDEDNDAQKPVGEANNTTPANEPSKQPIASPRASGEFKQPFGEPSPAQTRYINSLMLQKAPDLKLIKEMGIDVNNLTGGKEGTASKLINYLKDLPGGGYDERNWGGHKFLPDEKTIQIDEDLQSLGESIE